MRGGKRAGEGKGEGARPRYSTVGGMGSVANQDQAKNRNVLLAGAFPVLGKLPEKKKKRERGRWRGGENLARRSRRSRHVRCVEEGRGVWMGDGGCLSGASGLASPRPRSLVRPNYTRYSLLEPWKGKRAIVQVHVTPATEHHHHLHHHHYLPAQHRQPPATSSELIALSLCPV
jgi:hypothetical protein